MSDEERLALQAKADAVGLSLSAYVREQLFSASPTPPKTKPAKPAPVPVVPLSNVTPSDDTPTPTIAPPRANATPPRPAFCPALHPNDVGSLASRRAAASPFSRDTQRHAS